MKRTKIIAAGAALVVLIIIAAFSAMSIVQSTTVNNVEKAEVAQTSDSAVKLKWKRVSAADGYYIYSGEKGANDFERVQTVEDGKAKEATVKNLQQSTAYDFYVTAYKNAKKPVESKEYVVVSACTTPKKQSLVQLASNEEGAMNVTWEINPAAEGYEIQYFKGEGEDFSEAERVFVEDKAVADRKIEGLEVKAKYTARVRSYIHYGDEVVSGAWSEVKTVEIAEKVEGAENVDASKPMIALTFDDGPGYNDASDKILDVLEQYHVRATFFMVGENAKAHPDNVKRKVALNCELGNHTYDHNHYGDNVTVEDISKASEAIKEASGGAAPTAFRSPGGNTTKLIRKECKAEGMPLYYWSLDTQDWKSRDAEKIYNAVMNNVEDGDIILMHEIYDSTAEAVARMVPELIKQGYQIVTCQELVTAKMGSAPVAGEQYMNATTVKNETS